VRVEKEITVLPAPLGPTIRVKGLKKVMTFLFSGSKLRMPLISILSTVLIFLSAYYFLFYYFRMECEIGGAELMMNITIIKVSQRVLGTAEEGKRGHSFLSQLSRFMNY
jgi:hypothetical protein